MLVDEFSFELPESLIANHPAENRTGSRLLALDVDSGSLTHGKFPDLLNYLRPGDLLVFNDTRVIPARLFGHKVSGGRVEILIERVLENDTALVQLRANKPPKADSLLLLSSGPDSTGTEQHALRVVGRKEPFYVLASASGQSLAQLLEHYGHMPLPPYIKREDEVLDRERYQTVYARRSGAVAAPTAGLHFDEPLLCAIEEKGVGSAFLTLHVGAGTFQPIRVDNVQDHQMHSEWIEVSEELCAAVSTCKANGGRVVAVGTTSVRSLETAAQHGTLMPYRGETDIFIYPGYQFRVVDAMVTNFHLPQSTLLMLVSAFATKKMLLDAYQEAIKEGYRFFSYGDAMLLYHKG